jgi:hypothetical protein
MEHDSGQPEDLAGPGQERADDVPGQPEATGLAPAGPPEAKAGAPEALVDEVIAGLDGLPGRPLAEHVAVFEEAHAKLRRVLSDLDDSPADS